MSLIALVLGVLVVVVVGQLLFLGRTVVLGSLWRGEVVLNVVSRVYIGSRNGIVGFPGNFPVNVNIWYEVIVTNPFEILSLVVVPGIPGLRAVPDLVTIHPILPPTVHIQPYHD